MLFSYVPRRVDRSDRDEYARSVGKVSMDDLWSSSNPEASASNFKQERGAFVKQYDSWTSDMLWRSVTNASFAPPPSLDLAQKLKRCQQQLERVTAKLQEVVRVREANGAREGR